MSSSTQPGRPAAVGTSHGRGAFTLLEVVTVIALLVLVAYFVFGNYSTPLERSYLPESAERLRALINLTRANAMLDGKRYRIRFVTESDPDADELPLEDIRQPLVEIEHDPIEYPGEFTPLLSAWATEPVLLGEVWCYQVRFGEPTYESVAAELEEQEFEDDEEEELKAELGLEEDEPWVLVLSPDGTCDWMTFRLVSAPYDVEMAPEMLEEFPQVDVIVDGRLGNIFLQRPLSDEETELLMDKGHSPILRRDFLTTRELTDDDVLEIDMSGRH